MSGKNATESLLFDGFRLNRRGLFRLDPTGKAVPIAIGSRAFDLLLLLAGQAGTVVSKRDLMAGAWPGIAVEESNLTKQISALRRALDRNSGIGSYIQTVPGRGYRFAAAVTRACEMGATAPKLTLPEKPSLVVLPFQNMSGDPEQEYFADGMVEEIITALSRIRWLFVIARNSSFTYKGRTVDVKQVGRELGVRYVLEGSVRKADNRVRIAGQLIEAETGAHLWADRFDGSLEDVFDLQERIAISVAGVIEPTLQTAEIARSASRPTSDLSAYDLYLRANAMYSASQSQVPSAFELLEKAIARDPRYGPALALAAASCMHQVSNGTSPDRDTLRQKAIDYAQRALRVAGSDPAVLAEAAFALACFGEDIDAMLALVDRALMFNPSYARGWHISGWLRLWAGQTELAIEHAETTLRLSPRAQALRTSWLIGAALFFGRHFAEAVPKLRIAVDDGVNFPTPYRFLAACYAHMGLLDEARQTVKRLRLITPEIIPSYPLPFRNSEHRELYYSGLRLVLGEADRSTSRRSEPAPA